MRERERERKRGVRGESVCPMAKCIGKGKGYIWHYFRHQQDSRKSTHSFPVVLLGSFYVMSRQSNTCLVVGWWRWCVWLYGFESCVRVFVSFSVFYLILMCSNVRFVF